MCVFKQCDEHGRASGHTIYSITLYYIMITIVPLYVYFSWPRCHRGHNLQGVPHLFYRKDCSGDLRPPGAAEMLMGRWKIAWTSNAACPVDSRIG